MAADAPLELIPLGGLGEFGMNMMVVACGDTAILIDAGVMFPEPELLGVDLIIPDLRQLSQYRLSALVLTPLDGEHVDFHRLAELGSRGVLAMCGDSTNVDRKGFAGSERDVTDAFE